MLDSIIFDGAKKDEDTIRLESAEKEVRQVKNGAVLWRFEE